jgi:hypothetical protein
MRMSTYCGGKRCTLCWDCYNAGCGGCEWSKNLTPVKGWEAVKTHSEYGGDGYLVINCPKFIRDAENGGQVRLSMKELFKRTRIEDEEEIPDMYAV